MKRQRLFDLFLGALLGVGLLGWWQMFADGRVLPWVSAGEPRAASIPQSMDQDGDAGTFLMETAKATTGGALLFVLNTRSRVLNVYEADGGTRATRGVTFVGSRKIERDLYVTGYNDRSEYSYQDLLERFRVEETRAEALGEGGAGTDDDR